MLIQNGNRLFQLLKKQNLQQLHMENQDDQKLFDVLNLHKGNAYDLLTFSPDTQLPQEISQYLELRNEIKDQIEELPCTAESQDTDIYQENMEQDCQEKNQLLLENSQTQAFLQQNFYDQIQFSEEKRSARDLVYNGYHYETQNIGGHFKTATSTYLTLLLKTKSLDFEESEFAKQFFQTNGAIEDFSKLFQVQSLRFKCRQYYQSQTFMRSILSSGKMDLRSKFCMLRHLEKLRQMTFSQSKSWKLTKE